MKSIVLPDGYSELLTAVKKRVESARSHAAKLLLRELLSLNWDIGREILERQAAHGGSRGYGAGVIEQLSRDLLRDFPGSTGFSAHNLRYMRKFAQCWPDATVVPRLSWKHQKLLLDRVRASDERAWYAERAVERSWSVRQLDAQIVSGLYERHDKALTTFSRTLESSQASLAQRSVPDPIDIAGLFGPIGRQPSEREIEEGMVVNLRDMLLALGKGFAFCGSQLRFDVDGDEFKIDLLFYNTSLHRYIVFDLKRGKFNPRDLGQINFYRKVIDERLRNPNVDGETLGYVVCRERNAVVVQLALSGYDVPLGVTRYKLPRELEAGLPTFQELEAALEEDDIEVKAEILDAGELKTPDT